MRFRSALGPALFLTHTACLLVGLWFGNAATAGEVVPPPQSLNEPISVRAERAKKWNEGEYEVWLLHGNCVLQHGELTAHSRDAVLWIERSPPLSGQANKVIAYLETDVWMKGNSKSGTAKAENAIAELRLGKSWLGRFYTVSLVDVQATEPLETTVPHPPLYDRGVEALGWNNQGNVQNAQFIESLPPTPNVAAAPAPRNIQFSSRSSSGGSQTKSYPGSSPDEMIIVGTGGFRAVVSGITGVVGPDGIPLVHSGVVTLEADRFVLWTNGLSALQLGGDGINAAGRTEVYLEGNIVFKEGDRVKKSGADYRKAAESQQGKDFKPPKTTSPFGKGGELASR